MRYKWFIVAVLLLLAIPAQAQWFIGGRVSVNANFKEKSGGVILRPDVGYTFKNDIAVGVNGIFDYYGFTPNPGENRNSNISYGLAPYIQYYFVRIGKVLSPGMEIVLTDHWSFLGTLGRLDYDSFTKSFGFCVDGSAFSAGLYYTF